MKLGDTCSIKDVVGIVTYLDSDNNYAEITKTKNSICDLFTISNDDWISIEYENGSWKKNKDEVVIIKENLENSFICIKYLDGENIDLVKNIESQKNYNAIFSNNSSDLHGKSGDLFEILNIDKENGIITCINNEDENAEELYVDISKGISKKNISASSIVDFCEVSYSSSDDDSDDSDDDSDEDTNEDDGKPKQIFTMKDEINEDDKELTTQQKREFIGKSLRLMFKSKDLSGDDVIKLIDRIFNSLKKEFNSSLDFSNSIMKSEHIIPILSDYVIHETNTTFYEESNPYFSFVQNEISPLLIVDNNNSASITHNSEAKDASYRNIVLNPAYMYNNSRSILNSSDKVNILKYNIRGTDFEFTNLPPNKEEFEQAIKEDINILEVFNINKHDIPIEYANLIPKMDNKLNILKNNKLKYKKFNSYPLIKNSNTKIKEKVKKPNIGSYLKINHKNINIDNTLIWDNSVVWPRNIAINMSKLNPQVASYLLNNYEIGTNIPMGNNQRKEYLEQIMKNEILQEKLSRNVVQMNESKKNIMKLPKEEIVEKINPSRKAWNDAEKNPDTEIFNKIHILTSGKFVRDAIKGENPYYFIDILTKEKFVPRHELLKLRIQNVTYNSESKQLYDCLLNQWGKEEEHTTNIISIINNEFLGFKENEYNYLDNKSYIPNYLPEKNDKNIKFDEKHDTFMRIGFMSGFKTLITEFNSKVQYKIGFNIDFKEYIIIGTKFFNTDDWITFINQYSYPEKFEKNSDIINASKKLMRFEKNIEKLLVAFNSLKKKDPKDKKIPAIYKRLKQELVKSKENYTKKLWKLVGIYITSYLYSRLNISEEGKLKIYSKLSEDFKKGGTIPPWAEDISIFNEKTLKKYSKTLWEYNSIKENEYKYSYVKKIKKNSIFKSIKTSQLILSNNIKPLKYEQPLIEKSSKKSIHLNKIANNIVKPKLLQWELYNSKKIINDNKWYLLKTVDENEEKNYKCLLSNLCYIILQSSTSSIDFKFPKKLSTLKDKGYGDRMNSWLSEIYEIRNYIKNIEFSDKLIETIRPHIIQFREYIRINSNKNSSKQNWIYLMQHLINEQPESELQYTNYLNVLERVFSYYIENVQKFCGNNLSMQKSTVESIYASAAEDEASSFYNKNANNKVEQKINKEQQNRSLGLYAKGLQKQFDISTVQNAYSEDSGPNSFTSEYGQNFDNDDDHYNEEM
jgi:hypothetical protein